MIIFVFDNKRLVMKSRIEDYRTGAIGALHDEYEKSLGEILCVLEDVSQENFVKIMDEKTSDPDCRSIQTIMFHVINAGYGYSYYIRKAEQQDVDRITVPVENISEVGEKVREMFAYVLSTSESITGDLNEGKTWEELHFESPWGDVYNLEQILEHAIVHVMRHRRQIEKFLIRQR